MQSRLEQVLKGEEQNYIYPFFWQSGASPETIQTEMEKIYESGIRGFCVEARPHPDYGGPIWWRDMDQIMGFAREHDMKVWLLDDDRFPSGHANGAFSDGNNPLSVRFLTVHNTDVMGPYPDGILAIDNLLQDDDELIAVTAYRRASEDTADLMLETFVDLTERMEDGWLTWDVPEGLWRILVFFTTRHGNGKLDYFNILDSDSVRILLDQVYEKHYEHYAEDFGKTFLGFFSDEPEFSNLPWYDFQARLGYNMTFIPWSRELEERLHHRWQQGYARNLAALWYQSGEDTMHLRYEYMDETTKQLEVSFSRQIADWCQAHGVSHIGHIIEDDNSHGRLGCSTGHYFRSIGQMRMSGIDVVLQQIMPDMYQEEHQWVASNRGGEFFHFGLAKMGSSLAHIDAQKQGDALCEIFGAYGWREGTGLMKWLTDHMISRGINHFVPHAFSQKPYPDPDCPPHFYAHGKNPQYPLFGKLMEYMNRLSHLFTGGTYPANVAVLYHADSEWAGEAMLFQKPVRALMEAQLDCDVIPADLLEEENPYGAIFEKGKIHVSRQHYEALVIPGCEKLPVSVARFILQHREDMPIWFAGYRPTDLCESTDPPQRQELLCALQDIAVVPLKELAQAVMQQVKRHVMVSGNHADLRTYPYEDASGILYIFCFNESRRHTVQDRLMIMASETADAVYEYDVMHNLLRSQGCHRKPEGIEISLELKPGESKLFAVGEKEKIETEVLKQGGMIKNPVKTTVSEGKRLTEKWSVEVEDIEGGPRFSIATSEGEDAFPNIMPWILKNHFSGTVYYRTRLSPEEGMAGQYYMQLSGESDGVRLWINGILSDEIVGNTDHLELELDEGETELEIEMPLTPYWRDPDPWSSYSMIPAMGLTEKPILTRYQSEEK